MSIKNDIDWISAELTKRNDPDLVRHFKRLLADLAQEGTPLDVSVAQYNQELDAAIAQYRRGEVTDHQTFTEQQEQWEKKTFGK